MAPPWEEIPGPAGPLAWFRSAPRPGPTRRTVVLCHGFPLEREAAVRTGRTFPALADQVADESGWEVVTACLRGVGPSGGSFSLAGWLEDLGVVVERAARGTGAVWLAGFGTSGSLALCAAADDPRVRGVAALGASATFTDWGQDLPGMLEFARQVGVIRDPGFPADLTSWGSAFSELDPVAAAARVAPRPVLVVHGSLDEGVPVDDARALADAVGPSAELRIIAGAGHRLRAEPRAIALLLGWLDRQRP